MGHLCQNFIGLKINAVGRKCFHRDTVALGINRIARIIHPFQDSGTLIRAFAVLVRICRNAVAVHSGTAEQTVLFIKFVLFQTMYRISAGFKSKAIEVIVFMKSAVLSGADHPDDRIPILAADINVSLFFLQNRKQRVFGNLRRQNAQRVPDVDCRIPSPRGIVVQPCDHTGLFLRQQSVLVIYDIADNIPRCDPIRIV